MQQNRWLPFGMFMLWGLVLSLNILFRHAHRLPDGRIVSHVHPFKWSGEKGPVPYNPHSHSELSWLDAHSNNPYCGEAAVEFDFREEVPGSRLVVSLYSFTLPADTVKTIHPRGPPARVS